VSEPADREYIRVRRGKYLYDICGAPFAKGFFFSSWMAEKLPSPIWAIAGLFILLLIGFYSFFPLVYFGGFSGFMMWAIGVIAVPVVLIVLQSQEESPIGISTSSARPARVSQRFF
jgi:hypothetical protein